MTYKRRLPLDNFEQFVPSSKGKLVNDICFESVMERSTCKYFKLKSNIKNYVMKMRLKTFSARPLT